MKKLGIGPKLVISTCCLLVVSFLAFYVVVSYKMKTTFASSAQDKITAIRDNKAYAVEDFFHDAKKQAINMSSNEMVQSAFAEFSKYFTTYTSEEKDKTGKMKSLARFYIESFGEKYKAENDHVDEGKIARIIKSLEPNQIDIQYDYISNNKNKLGEKNSLASANENPWSKSHKHYHSYFDRYLAAFGYYDIFLIDNKTGMIIYSVFKEIDFGTSLVTGPLKETKFAKAFQMAKAAKSADEAFIVDLEAYYPSYEAPASFLTSPIFLNGQNVGTLAIQLPLDKIDSVLTNSRNWKNAGFGETAEAFIIGGDKVLRSLARPMVERPSEFYELLAAKKYQKSEIDYIKNKNTTALTLNYSGVDLSKESSIHEVENFLGEEVYLASRPLQLLGLDWYLATTINKSEVYSPYVAARYFLIACALLLLLGSSVLVYWGSKKFTAPILIAKQVVENLEGGKVQVDFPIETQDEIGDLLSMVKLTNEKLVNIFKTDQIQWEEVEKQKERELEALELAKKESMKAQEESRAAQEAKQAAEEAKHAAEAMALEAQEARASAESMAKTAEDAKSTAEEMAREAQEAKRAAETMAEKERLAAQENEEKVRLILLTVSKAESGDLTKRTVMDSNSELGAVANGLNTFLEDLKQRIYNIVGVNQNLVDSSKLLKDLSTQFKEGSAQSLNLSTRVNEIVGDFEKNFVSINKNTSEMDIALKSILKSTITNSSLTREAVRLGDETNVKFKELEDSSLEIASIVKLIGKISSQTNLLALNATIEAARAGEAGKGFAIVASEVKELAKQTSEAAVSIHEKIEHVQESTHSLLEAIHKTKDIIQKIDESSTSVGASIEEHSAMTSEITNTVRMAQKEIGQIRSNIETINEMSKQTAEKADDTDRASEQIIDINHMLTSVVNHFQVEDRAS